MPQSRRPRPRLLSWLHRRLFRDWDFVRLGIDDRQTKIRQLASRAQTISDLIQFGARWEDDKSWEQALRHFYDPVNNRPLVIDDHRADPFIVASPDWALESPQALQDQAHSYQDARRHFYDALTGLSEIERKKSFGLMFQSIGHVIHHVQDMAQPQHVRNDVHCDRGICKTLFPHVYAPSQYEKYTDLDSPTDPRLQIRINLPFEKSGSSPFIQARTPQRYLSRNRAISGGRQRPIPRSRMARGSRSTRAETSFQPARSILPIARRCHLQSRIGSRATNGSTSSSCFPAPRCTEPFVFSRDR